MGLRAGFVGVGRIGTPMALRALRAGFPLAVHDARPEALQRLVDAGAKGCASAAEVARACEVACVVVLDDAQTREVVAGRAGLLAGASPGSVICICSTVSESTVLELGAQAAARGVQLLDAGVAGGVPSAESGSLVTMIGGDASASERARPLLESFSKELIHAGPAGAGMRLKLVKNLMSYLALAAAHEGRLLAEAAGFDGALARRVADSTALLEQFFRYGLERAGAQRLAPDAARAELEHAVAYAAVARKDLAAALALADALGVELPVTACAMRAVGALFRLPAALEPDAR